MDLLKYFPSDIFCKKKCIYLYIYIYIYVYIGLIDQSLDLIGYNIPFVLDTKVHDEIKLGVFQKN